MYAPQEKLVCKMQLSSKIWTQSRFLELFHVKPMEEQ